MGKIILSIIAANWIAIYTSVEVSYVRDSIRYVLKYILAKLFSKKKDVPQPPVQVIVPPSSCQTHTQSPKIEYKSKHREIDIGILSIKISSDSTSIHF